MRYIPEVRYGTIGNVTSAASSPSTPTPGGGKALAGFLLSGFLLAMLGAVLPAWGYHRDPADFIAVGNYFLSLAVGIVGATLFARKLMARYGVGFLLVFACVLSTVALAYLAMVPPPASSWLRVAGLLVLGMGAGLLNMALFHAISKSYTQDAAGTVNRGGVWYGLGCVTATLLVYLYTNPAILLFLAAVPALFATLYFRTSYAAAEGGLAGLRESLDDFRSPGAVMFALLLFFQFGNEWSIAGWLPLFLNRRLGLSPKAALFVLVLYWFFLMAGRLGAVAILPRVRHGKLLLGSVVAALFGCIVLYFTDNEFGAAMGALFLGAGYASIYPLVAEAIGRRFPYYHPGFFNGIFSLALVGGLVAPATLGYAAEVWGVGVVIGVPLVGTFLVMTLLLLIWLESKVTGR
jgi:MFS transporter, FHS family, glucose/mannose:H+ symporter